MAMTMYAEQRACERVSLMFHTQVIDCATEHVIGMLSDISLRGLRVVGETGVNPGQELEVRLPLPVETSGESEIRVSCESRWSRRDVSTDSIHTGLRMTSLDARQSSLLESVIQEFGIGPMLAS
ncbi:MAG: PilZ domain-containing protein [Pseudomonadota bacterium]